jgi:hypothetical protein
MPSLLIYGLFLSAVLAFFGIAAGIGFIIFKHRRPDIRFSIHDSHNDR